MKKLLILGGLGFLGKHLNKIVDKQKYAVYNESRRTGFDLLNPEVVQKRLNDIKPDVIINCAAHTGSLHYVSEFAADVLYDNVSMYLNLYKVVDNALIVNPLSNCSYPGVVDIQKEEEWWDGPVHDSVLPYGMSKRMGYIISRCHRHVRTINLLLPNAYGPLDDTDPNKVHALNGMIIRMIHTMRNGSEAFVVWGTGKPIREWIYMEDAARLIVKCIERDNLPNPLNLAQARGISIADTARTIKEILGFEGRIIFDPSKKDGAPIKILCDKNFRHNFKDFVFTDYKEGIKRTVEYYKGTL